MDLGAYANIDHDTLKYITKDNSINSDIISNEFESFSLKQSINEDLKTAVEIVAKDGSRNRFSSKRFGEPLTNPNPFATKYHCHCIDGLGLNGRINAGLCCPRCGHLCEYIEEDTKDNKES